jgi:crotonobetainyl-CoA:carnitine CoA-transferase CaiB-like acyl-CoA transferase
MAEVVETYDLTAPSQDGWAVDHRIRREDGEELHAEVRCWEKAHAAAQRAANAEALAAIADRGVAAALEYAEVVQSPATRGAVLISIWFDPLTMAICAVASATSALSTRSGTASNAPPERAARQARLLASPSGAPRQG